MPWTPYKVSSSSLALVLISSMLNISLIILDVHIASATTQLDLAPIPMPCDSIKCPPDADMQCPEDSSIRDDYVMEAVDLINSNANKESGSTTSIVYNNDSLVDEALFAQCCLSKKCICNTCKIWGCNDTEVLIELQPETMDTPGQCCGEYECQAEPDCQEIKNTDYHWLHNCQRCLCTSGVKICEQKCDEAQTPKAICQSNNKYYEDGKRWVDGCYQCECNKTEVKCWSSFCVALNCPRSRQVHLTGSCCPVCWPKGHPMPDEKHGNYDEGYGYDEGEQEYPRKQIVTDTNTELPLATEIVTVGSSSSSSSSSSTTSTTSTTELPAIETDAKKIPSDTIAQTPCQIRELPNEVVVHPLNGFKDPHLYHIIIVVLVGIIGILYFYIRHLLAKQRSYVPVSSLDDKV